MHPLAFFVVDDKEDGCDRPCERIGKRHGCHLMTEWDRNENPRDPEDAYAKAGKQHRNEGIPAAAARSGQDLDADIGNIERGNDADHSLADADDVLVMGKEQQDRPAKLQHDKAQRNARCGGKAETDADAFFDAVIFASAEVLPRKGRSGNAVCTHDHPENAVHLGVSRPCGDRVRAEGVDGGLDQQVGNGVHGRLKACGQPNLDD